MNIKSMKKMILVGLLLVVGGVGVFVFNLDKNKDKSTNQNNLDNLDVTDSPIAVETQDEELIDQGDLPEEVVFKYDKLRAEAEKAGINVIKVDTNGKKSLDYEKLNEYEEYMRTEGTTYVSAESIVIWFENFPSDLYSLEERQKIAFEILSGLRDRIEVGEITMKEAGDIIKQDTSLKDIDEAWMSNAYREILFAKKDGGTFFDPEVENLLWSMKPGELSPVLTGRKVISNNSMPDAYYMVLKVHAHEEKEYDSYNGFLNSQ